jgi:hypothetical protein
MYRQGVILGRQPLDSHCNDSVLKIGFSHSISVKPLLESEGIIHISPTYIYPKLNESNIVHLHPVAHRYFTFTFLIPSLCGLSMFETLYNVFNTFHFFKSLKHYMSQASKKTTRKRHTEDRGTKEHECLKSAIFLINNFVIYEDGQFRPKHAVF